MKMRLSERLYALWLAIWIPSAVADSWTMSASQCLPGSGVTAFPNCIAAFNSTDSCRSGDVTKFESCYCDQRVLNSIYGYVKKGKTPVRSLRTHRKLDARAKCVFA